MYQAQYDPKNAPGTWSGGKRATGERTALFTCPQCSGIGSLLDHTISVDGMVTPSVVCMYSDCTFHEFVQLLDWSPDVDG